MKKYLNIFLSILILCSVNSLLSQNFDGIKLYINPGHGGNDASNDRYIPLTGFWESESNLTKGLHLRDLLQNAGAIVFMSRTQNRDIDDLPLSQISADANANDVDYFHSIHSNGLNGNTYVNYPLMLFRGYDDAPVFPDAKAMGSIMWYKMHEADNEWTDWPYSWSPNNRGDWSFYPQWGTSGLGVLRGLSMPGTLSEGSFHDYFPNSFRLMNMDYRKHESIVIFRSFVEFYGLDAWSHGVLAGIVRDKSKSASYSYTYNSGLPNDQYLTINNARVRLLGHDKQYLVDNKNNGFYMFDSLAPGDYQVIFESGTYQADTLNATVVANKTTKRNAFLTEDPNKAPEVYATIPSSDQTAVPTNQNLQFIFSQSMNKSSVENAISVNPATNGTFTWSDNSTLNFRQIDAFDTLTSYTVTVSSAAQNASGKNLTQDYQFNFTTSENHIHPVVTDYYPGTEIDSAAIDVEIKITFDTQMRTAETEAAFSLQPSVSGTFNWNDNKTEMSFKPDQNLERFKEYTINLSKAALNSYGIPLSEDLVFNFWTRNRNEVAITRSFPADSEENVSPKMIFSLQFNAPLSSDVLSTDISLKDENGAVKRIKSLIVYDEHLRFSPSSELNTDTWYHLIVFPTIKDIYGLKLEDTVFVDFKTEAETFGGNVFEDFEEIGFWESPKDNATTTGVDSKDTYFIISSNQKINGSFSGGLYYKFSTESSGICRLTNTEKFPTTSNSGSTFGIWVYGDFSRNQLEFWFDKGGVQTEVQVGIINWAGWKFIKFPMDHISGSGLAEFHSIVIRQAEGALPGDVLYFDDGQYDVVSDIDDTNLLTNTPEIYQLDQNYPNPFNPETTIRYHLPVQGKVKLVIYDILGKKVATLVDDELSAGEYRINWNAGHMPTGVYFYRLEAGEFVQTRKLLLIK
jgi:hypothetical protein